MARASEFTGSRAQALLPVLPAAAVLIALVCWWKLAQEPVTRSDSQTRRDLRPCPAFELPDQNSRLLRLDRYLHRHPILLVFFDGETGAGANPWLRAISANYDAVEKTGTIVIGVSQSLPQVNRQTEVPFPLLTDLNPAQPGSTGRVHKEWGVVDAAGQATPAVFYIDRARQVQWDGEHPQPLADPATVVRALVQGRSPEAVL